MKPLGYEHVIIDGDGIHLDDIMVDALKLLPEVTVHRTGPNRIDERVTFTVYANQVTITEAAKQLESASIIEKHGGASDG